jgi:hypothetical protein
LKNVPSSLLILVLDIDSWVPQRKSDGDGQAVFGEWWEGRRAIDDAVGRRVELGNA